MHSIINFKEVIIKSNPPKCPKSCKVRTPLVLKCEDAYSLDAVQLATCLKHLKNILIVDLQFTQEMCSCILLDYVREIAESDVVTFTSENCGVYLITSCDSYLPQDVLEMSNRDVIAGLVIDQLDPNWRRVIEEHVHRLWHRVNSLEAGNSKDVYRKVLLDATKSELMLADQFQMPSYDRILPFMKFTKGMKSQLFERTGWYDIRNEKFHGENSDEGDLLERVTWIALTTTPASIPVAVSSETPIHGGAQLPENIEIVTDNKPVTIPPIHDQVEIASEPDKGSAQEKPRINFVINEGQKPQNITSMTSPTSYESQSSTDILVILGAAFFALTALMACVIIWTCKKSRRYPKGLSKMEYGDHHRKSTADEFLRKLSIYRQRQAYANSHPDIRMEDETARLLEELSGRVPASSDSVPGRIVTSRVQWDNADQQSMHDMWLKQTPAQQTSSTLNRPRTMAEIQDQVRKGLREGDRSLSLAQQAELYMPSTSRSSDWPSDRRAEPMMAMAKSERTTEAEMRRTSSWLRQEPNHDWRMDSQAHLTQSEPNVISSQSGPSTQYYSASMGDSAERVNPTINQSSMSVEVGEVPSDPWLVDPTTAWVEYSTRPEPEIPHSILLSDRPDIPKVKLILEEQEELKEDPLGLSFKKHRSSIASKSQSSSIVSSEHTKSESGSTMSSSPAEGQEQSAGADAPDKKRGKGDKKKDEKKEDKKEKGDKKDKGGKGDAKDKGKGDKGDKKEDKKDKKEDKKDKKDKKEDKKDKKGGSDKDKKEKDNKGGKGGTKGGKGDKTKKMRKPKPNKNQSACKHENGNQSALPGKQDFQSFFKTKNEIQTNLKAKGLVYTALVTEDASQTTNETESQTTLEPDGECQTTLEINDESLATLETEDESRTTVKTEDESQMTSNSDSENQTTSETEDQGQTTSETEEESQATLETEDESQITLTTEGENQTISETEDQGQTDSETEEESQTTLETEDESQITLETESESQTTLETEDESQTTSETEDKSQTTSVTEDKSKNTLETEDEYQAISDTEDESQNTLETEDESQTTLETENESQSNLETEDEGQNTSETEDESQTVLETEDESQNTSETEDESQTVLETEDESQNTLETEIESHITLETEDEYQSDHGTDYQTQSISESEYQTQSTYGSEEQSQSVIKRDSQTQNAYEGEKQTQNAYKIEHKTSANRTENEIHIAYDTEGETHSTYKTAEEIQLKIYTDFKTDSYTSVTTDATLLPEEASDTSIVQCSYAEDSDYCHPHFEGKTVKTSGSSPPELQMYREKCKLNWFSKSLSTTKLRKKVAHVHKQSTSDSSKSDKKRRRRISMTKVGANLEQLFHPFDTNTCSQNQVKNNRRSAEDAVFDSIQNKITQYFKATSAFKPTRMLRSRTGSLVDMNQMLTNMNTMDNHKANFTATPSIQEHIQRQESDVPGVPVDVPRVKAEIKKPVPKPRMLLTPSQIKAILDDSLDEATDSVNDGRITPKGADLEEMLEDGKKEEGRATLTRKEMASETQEPIDDLLTLPNSEALDLSGRCAVHELPTGSSSGNKLVLPQLADRMSPLQQLLTAEDLEEMQLTKSSRPKVSDDVESYPDNSRIYRVAKKENLEMPGAVPSPPHRPQTAAASRFKGGADAAPVAEDCWTLQKQVSSYLYSSRDSQSSHDHTSSTSSRDTLNSMTSDSRHDSDASLVCCDSSSTLECCKVTYDTHSCSSSDHSDKVDSKVFTVHFTLCPTVHLSGATGRSHDAQGIDGSCISEKKHVSAKVNRSQSNVNKIEASSRRERTDLSQQQTSFLKGSSSAICALSMWQKGLSVPRQVLHFGSQERRAGYKHRRSPAALDTKKWVDSRSVSNFVNPEMSQYQDISSVSDQVFLGNKEWTSLTPPDSLHLPASLSSIHPNPARSFVSYISSHWPPEAPLTLSYSECATGVSSDANLLSSAAPALSLEDSKENKLIHESKSLESCCSFSTAEARMALEEMDMVETDLFCMTSQSYSSILDEVNSELEFHMVHGTFPNQQRAEFHSSADSICRNFAGSVNTSSDHFQNSQAIPSARIQPFVDSTFEYLDPLSSLPCTAAVLPNTSSDKF